MLNTRAYARLYFAQLALGRCLEIAPASADASFRSYWRVTDQDGQSHIVMDAPIEHENCGPFIDIAARLEQAGLRVPSVLAQDLAQGFLLLPDLGTRTLLPELHAGNVSEHYQHAMASILRMQRFVSVDGLLNYDANRLDAEMELFPEWFLKRHLNYIPSCEEFDLIEATLTLLRNTALSQPKVFVHRDFHSRNLMLASIDSEPHQRMALIDFQDAVRGPITYDLVSLLRDCYIAWPQNEVEKWVESYRVASFQAGMHRADRVGFLRWFDWMGVQRHLKVLGIFARLNYRDGKSGYLKDLPLVLHYTLSVCERYSELRTFANWLRGLTANLDVTREAAR
jgi:N-acetylmuramate 1-kinase